MRSILELLIRLFPSHFEARFGAEMLDQIRRDYALARTGGLIEAFAFTLATSVDFVGCVVLERCWPTLKRTPPRAIGTSRGEMGIDGWRADLRAASRSLRRSPGFTLLGVCALGLAIGVNAAVFSVVDHALLNPLPFPDADRLVYIAASAPGSERAGEFGVSNEFYVQYAEQADLLEGVAIFSAFTSSLRVGDRVERVPMSGVTPSLFETLRATPHLGRLPVAEDRSEVAVLSHSLWASWFSADPDVIGQVHYIAGQPRTVIGVMRPGFSFPDDRKVLWVPLNIEVEDIVVGRFGRRMIGRMAPGVEQDDLVAQLAVLAGRLPERFGGSPKYARLIELHRPVVRPLARQLHGASSGSLWVLFAAVAVVLLIACANVANLCLVRADGRQRDLAMRRAIGASRGQLIRSQMAEALIVAGCAALVAVALAWLGVPVLMQAAPSALTKFGTVSVTGSTLLFTAIAALVSALACGLMPAVRSSLPDLTRLRDGGRGSTRRRHWVRDALVVAQTAMALVLLVGSGLLVRSFQELRAVDPGYQTDDVFTFQIAPAENPELTDAESFARFHLGFLEQLAELPGVESVGLVENVPLSERTVEVAFETEDMGGDVDQAPLARATWSAGAYFEAMGIELLRGRTFSRDDHLASLGNVIISESAAYRLWPGEDPIGRRLRPETVETWSTVIGVVGDVKQMDFRNASEPLAYFPLVGRGPSPLIISSPAYVVRTARAETIAPEIRSLVREAAPLSPMYRAYTMKSLEERSMVTLSFTMLILGIASVLALTLGVIGLYGVLSYVVAERTQEIGVRMALGARAGQIRTMVVSRGIRVVILGVVVGGCGCRIDDTGSRQPPVRR